jgi:hypothetical protein
VYVLDSRQSKICQLAANGSLITYAPVAASSGLTYGLALSSQQPSRSSVGLYTVGFGGEAQVLHLSMAGANVSALNLNGTSARAIAVNSASVVHVLPKAGTTILRVAANGALLPPLLVPGSDDALNPAGLAVSLTIDGC